MTARFVLTAALIGLATFAPGAEQTAQGEQLPALLRTNTFVAGQVYGCIVRFETYLALSLQAMQTAGTTIPAAANHPSDLFGIDLVPLKNDLRALLLNQPGADEMEAALGAIETMARTEYAGTDLAGGYMPPWMHVAGCGTLFRQLSLYDAYPA